MHKLIKNKNYIFLSITAFLITSALILSIVAITRTTPKESGIKSATVMFMLMNLSSDNSLLVKFNVIAAGIGSIIAIITSTLLLIYIVFIARSYLKKNVAISTLKKVWIGITIIIIISLAILSIITALNITNLDWITANT